MPLTCFWRMILMAKKFSTFDFTGRIFYHQSNLPETGLSGDYWVVTIAGMVWRCPNGTQFLSY